MVMEWVLCINAFNYFMNLMTLLTSKIFIWFQSLSSGGMGFSDNPSLNITYDTTSSPYSNNGNVFTQFMTDSSISSDSKGELSEHNSTLSKLSTDEGSDKSSTTISRSFTNVDTGKNYMRDFTCQHISSPLLIGNSRHLLSSMNGLILLLPNSSLGLPLVTVLDVCSTLLLRLPHWPQCPF